MKTYLFITSLVFLAFSAAVQADSTSCSDASAQHRYLFQTYIGGALPPPDMMKDFNRQIWTIGDHSDAQGYSGEFSDKRILHTTRNSSWISSTYSTEVALRGPGMSPTLDLFMICEENQYIGPPMP